MTDHPKPADLMDATQGAPHPAVGAKRHPELKASGMKWRKAKQEYWTSCEGLNSDKRFVDANDPDTTLYCYETGEPIEDWCSNCMGWEAVCDLAAQESDAERAAKREAQP